MFKIIMNGIVVDSTRGFEAAIRKALKIKELFCKAGEISVEDPKGFIIHRIGARQCF